LQHSAMECLSASGLSRCGSVGSPVPDFHKQTIVALLVLANHDHEHPVRHPDFEESVDLGAVRLVADLPDVQDSTGASMQQAVK
jgi:hypothetical protein